MTDTNSTLSGMLGGNTPQGGGISGLFSNPLFLQYLSGAGAALSSGQPVGVALNNVTMQNIAAQNQAKLLSNMLSGMPAGAKLTADRDSLNLKMPSAALGGESSMMDTGAASKGVAMQPTSTPEASQNKFLGGLLNPSSSPLGNISPADLAGLTPTDITQAVSLAQTIKEREAAGEVARMNAATSAYKALSKDERTVAMKNFEYAKSQGYEGSFAEFQRDAKTSHIKDYEYAVNNGYKGNFQSWLRDMTALGGGLSLGEFKARKQITGLEERKDYFKSPKGLISDVDKYLNTEDAQNTLIQYEGPEAARQRAIMTEKYIDDKIQSSDAKLINKRLDGNTFIWELKWPDGSTSEVRRDIKLD